MIATPRYIVGAGRCAVLAFAASLLPNSHVHAQSLLDRPANVSGDWVGTPGTVYFTLMHRFVTSDPPARKVTNSPTLLVAAGLPKRMLVGFNYSSNSALSPRYPNEWEFFTRGALLSQEANHPVDLAGQLGYNVAAEGVDGEVSLARRQGPLRLIAASRVLSDADSAGKTRFALAGGATLQLGSYIALAADAATLANKRAGEKLAWSLGLNLAIPLTPHTLSLHATNVAVNTLQGQSRGGSEMRWGFEFVVPLTLRRYFGSRGTTPVAVAASSPLATDQPTASVVGAQPAPAPTDSVAVDSTAKPPAVPATRDSIPRTASDSALTRSAAAGRAAGVTTPPPPRPRPAVRTARISIRNIAYATPNIEVPIGSTVEWRNNDQMPHTVTATDRSFDSGFLRPGATFSRTFTRAGRFSYTCLPHPFMKGVVVVK
jgi:plastocyanin